MKNLGERVLDLRKKINLTQADLAQRIGISLTQLARYERNEVHPPADVLKKMADVLNTSIDYLIMGDKDQKAKTALKDQELLTQFKAVEAMSEKDKAVVKTLIDAFITKRQIQKLAH